MFSLLQDNPSPPPTLFLGFPYSFPVPTHHHRQTGTVEVESCVQQHYKMTKAHTQII